MAGTRFGHTNIISRDWQALADFYTEVFGCERLDPERDLSGEWVDDLAGMQNVRIRGVHLSLPGFPDGPTLEIFSYTPAGESRDMPEINQFGFGHIAFQVEDVEQMLTRLMEYGGSQVGRVIQRQYEELGLLTAVYARDPEGNIIELQNWRR